MHIYPQLCTHVVILMMTPKGKHPRYVHGLQQGVGNNIVRRKAVHSLRGTVAKHSSTCQQRFWPWAASSQQPPANRARSLASSRLLWLRVPPGPSYSPMNPSFILLPSEPPCKPPFALAGVDNDLWFHFAWRGYQLHGRIDAHTLAMARSPVAGAFGKQISTFSATELAADFQFGQLQSTPRTCTTMWVSQ